MANCKGECNKQLQGLAARLAHAEDNITNHFMGLSTLVESLSVNPLTAGSSAPLLAIYNSLPSGMQLMQMLKDALPDIDAITMKKMMLAASEAMLDTLANTIDQVAGAMIAEASNAVALAEGVVVGAEDALASAIMAGDQLAIDAATLTLSLAKDSLSASKLSLESITNFMTSQSNISKCKTKDLLMGN